MIKSKSKDGKHEIVFNDKPKARIRYRMDDKPAVSVTTFIKAGLPTGENLINWKIKQASAWVFDNVQKGSIATKDDVMKMSTYAWKDKAQQEADVGVILHDYAELKGKGYWEDAAMSLVNHKDHKDWSRIASATRAFDEFDQQNHDDIVKLEEIVGSLKYWFAGRFDRLAQRGKHLILTDYKTSKYFYPEQFIQDAAYAIAIEEWLGLKVTGFEVIRFPKDDTAFDSKLITDPKLVRQLKDQALRCLDTYNTMKVLNKEMK